MRYFIWILDVSEVEAHLGRSQGTDKAFTTETLLKATKEDIERY